MGVLIYPEFFQGRMVESRTVDLPWQDGTTVWFQRSWHLIASWTPALGLKPHFALVACTGPHRVQHKGKPSAVISSSPFSPRLSVATSGLPL
jgi:hypothetical protein